MNKKEMYTALKEKGIEMKSENDMTAPEVKELYDKNFDSSKLVEEKTVEKEDTSVKKEKKVDSLFFRESFWSNELEKSFTKGYYMPKNVKEYEALKKYSKRK